MSLETLTKLAEQQQLDMESPTQGTFPFLFGNDVDSVDVATRVAMVKFLCSPNLMGNFGRHTRTLRLYPRPIVSIQMRALLGSRSKPSPFVTALLATQAVECFAEWSLSPTNLAFRRILEGTYDPIQIGDKPRWFSHHLLTERHNLWPENYNLLKLLQLPKTESSDDESSSVSFSSESDEGIVENASLDDGEKKQLSDASFPSDVSVAGSDAALETSSDNSNIVAAAKIVKPPTPTVTPRCSSPMKSVFDAMPAAASGDDKPAVNPPPTVDEVQDLFNSIEQLTFNAKFDFSRMHNIKTAVSREKLTTVGKSMVGNLATTSKKLEFFKALAGSAAAQKPTTKAKEEPMTMSSPSTPAKSCKNGHIKQTSTPPPPSPPPPPTSLPTVETVATERIQSPITRPLSPKYDISFPKSNLAEIASPRPSSRIPKKERLLKTVSSSNNATTAVSATTTEEQSDHQIITVDNVQEEAVKSPAIPPAMIASSPAPLSSTRAPIETTTSRFLAEHHPQLTRSNSTLSNASAYSQTTQDLFSSISSDLSGLATQTTSLIESMFGYSGAYGGQVTSRSVNSPTSHSSLYEATVSVDNSIVLKEAVDRVLMGEGIGWLKLNRMRKLMEEEMHRSLLLNYLQRKFGQHLTRDGHIEDLCLGKPVWKGVTRLLSAVIHGLEVSFSFSNASTAISAGVASSFQLLELIHTHYWSPAENMGISSATSPIVGDGRATNVALQRLIHPDLERAGSNESAGSSTLQDNAFETESESGSLTETGSMVAPASFKAPVNSNMPRRSVMSEGEIDNVASLYSTIDKQIPKKSILSTGHRFRCGTLEPVVMDASQWAEKSYLFESFVGLRSVTMSRPQTPSSTTSSTAPISVGVSNPSNLWQDLQFWEDLFCDTVAQERQLIGMDSAPDELLDRYKTLAENEKRVLENDEDRLLSVILYNLTAFMLLMQVLTLITYS